VHAQDDLIDGYYEAETLPWTREGEWAKRTEGLMTYLTTSMTEARLTIPVVGRWLTIYRHPEFGNSEMYVSIDGCVAMVQAESVHDAYTPVAFPLEGYQTLVIQNGSGRIGIDAIEISPYKPIKALAQWKESNPCARNAERQRQQAELDNQKRLADQQRRDEINAKAAPFWAGLVGIAIFVLIMTTLADLTKHSAAKDKQKREETHDSETQAAKD
jgi:hypothetical protein